MGTKRIGGYIMLLLEGFLCSHEQQALHQGMDVSCFRWQTLCLRCAWITWHYCGKSLTLTFHHAILLIKSRYFQNKPYLFHPTLYERRTRKILSENTAILGSFDHYSTFSFRGKTLTFRTCEGLEKYTRIIRWDNGYIEVMAKYKQKEHEIEEYINLNPVLEGLYMDKEAFLSPIERVEIHYA